VEIRVLVENSSQNKRLKPEFGLSLLLKHHGRNILFDMGASQLFAENAALLDENIDEIDCAVISHAHYDHGGGLATFLKHNHSALIYVGKAFDGDYYGNIGARLPLWLEPYIFPLVKTNKKLSRYIGIDTSLIHDNPERFVVVDQFQEICDGVYILADIKETHAKAMGNKYLLELEGGRLKPDRFDHEIVLIIREKDGLILFTGCGHKSIVNMMHTVAEEFQGDRIKAVVGGFHLALQPGKPGIAGTREDVADIAGVFDAYGVEKVITGHCTGEEGCAILQSLLGRRFSTLSTGLEYEL